MAVIGTSADVGRAPLSFDMIELDSKDLRRLPIEGLNRSTLIGCHSSPLACNVMRTFWQQTEL
jgi:hypothetical protein